MSSRITFSVTKDVHDKLKEKCRSKGCSQQQMLEDMLAASVKSDNI